jgi:hypothetical protein
MTTETRLMTMASSGGVMTAARSEGLQRNKVKALLTPRRKTSEQVGVVMAPKVKGRPLGSAE